jgi:tellurite resistance protein
MTPAEKNIVRSLVAVAWVDGKLESGESSVIEGLLTGFDASEDEEREILEYAKTRRTLENDIPLADLDSGDRELLLSNAALLTHADGSQSPKERAVLKKLAEILGFSREEANDILASVSDGALRLSERALEPDER